METNDNKITADASMSTDQLRSDMDTIKNVLAETDKDRDFHRMLIAGGNFLCGTLMLIAVPIILMAVGIVGVATPETQPGEPSPSLIVGTAAVFGLIIICLLSLPFLLAGWGLFRRKNWGTAMAIIAGVLNLGNIPLGTALGIYTFWAVARGKLSTTPE